MALAACVDAIVPRRYAGGLKFLGLAARILANGGDVVHVAPVYFGAHCGVRAVVYPFAIVFNGDVVLLKLDHFLTFVALIAVCVTDVHGRTKRPVVALHRSVPVAYVYAG